MKKTTVTGVAVYNSIVSWKNNIRIPIVNETKSITDPFLWAFNPIFVWFREPQFSSLRDRNSIVVLKDTKYCEQSCNRHEHKNADFECRNLNDIWNTFYCWLEDLWKLNWWFLRKLMVWKMGQKHISRCKSEEKVNPSKHLSKTASKLDDLVGHVWEVENHVTWNLNNRHSGKKNPNNPSHLQAVERRTGKTVWKNGQRRLCRTYNWLISEGRWRTGRFFHHSYRFNTFYTVNKLFKLQSTIGIIMIGKNLCIGRVQWA